MGSTDLDTIFITITDYYLNDYKHLRAPIRYSLIKEILYKIVGEFIIGVESR